MNKCTFGVGKNQNKYVFDSGSVLVPNQFELVPNFIFSLEPQPKKWFGSTKKWNQNHDHRFGFGLYQFPTVPEPVRGSTSPAQGKVTNMLGKRMHNRPTFKDKMGEVTGIGYQSNDAPTK